MIKEYLLKVGIKFLLMNHVSLDLVFLLFVAEIDPYFFLLLLVTATFSLSHNVIIYRQVQIKERVAVIRPAFALKTGQEEPVIVI